MAVRMLVPILAGIGMAALAAAPASANLLQNGSAETGDTVPWVSTADGTGINDADAVAGIQAVQIAQDNKPLSSIDGLYFFSFSEAGANNTGNRFIMAQTGVLPGGASALSLSGFFSSEFDDFGEVMLEILDAGASQLASIGSGALNNAADNDPDFTWTGFDLDLAVPTGAASWRVTLSGELVTGGSINVYYDQLALDATVIPEPASLVLLGTGLAVVPLLRRRRRAASART